VTSSTFRSSSGFSPHWLAENNEFAIPTTFTIVYRGWLSASSLCRWRILLLWISIFYDWVVKNVKISRARRRHVHEKFNAIFILDMFRCVLWFSQFMLSGSVPRKIIQQLRTNDNWITKHAPDIVVIPIKININESSSMASAENGISYRQFRLTSWRGSLVSNYSRICSDFECLEPT
jgi:hypothetical protein